MLFSGICSDAGNVLRLGKACCFLFMLLAFLQAFWLTTERNRLLEGIASLGLLKPPLGRNYKKEELGKNNKLDNGLDPVTGYGSLFSLLRNPFHLPEMLLWGLWVLYWFITMLQRRRGKGGKLPFLYIPSELCCLKREEWTILSSSSLQPTSPCGYYSTWLLQPPGSILLVADQTATGDWKAKEITAFFMTKSLDLAQNVKYVLISKKLLQSFFFLIATIRVDGGTIFLTGTGTDVFSSCNVSNQVILVKPRTVFCNHHRCIAAVSPHINHFRIGISIW